jgi:hypothetical protein
MTEKQLFAVLVRAFGILIFLQGLEILWFALSALAVPTQRDFFLPVEAPRLVYGLVSMVVGGSMIRWPGWVVHLAWLERLPTIGRTGRDDDTRAD